MKTYSFLQVFSMFKKHSVLKFTKSFLVIIISAFPLTGISQPENGSKEDDHELTIYVVRSVGPINWESPSTLYKSYIKSYVSHVFRKKMSLTGHLFIKLSTPLLEEPLYTGMCTPSRKERRICVLKEKIGLGVLGASMKAKLENKNDLMKKIDYYSGKNEIAFITYHLNEQSARRIIDFYNGFTSKSQINNIPADYYGGAFWPRYLNEGAGCSALGMAMLEVIGLAQQESKLWVRKVNIPMNLIGGRFNKMHQVGSRMIKKTSCWHNGSGIEETDYIPFSVYDPSLIYNWIIQQRLLPNQRRCSGYFLSDEAIIPGLSADRRYVKIRPEEPIFVSRKDSNMFIRKYYESMHVGSDHE